MAGAAVSSPARGQSTPAVAPSINASTLKPWVDQLPIVPLAKSTGFRPSPESSTVKIPYYRIPMREMQLKLHRDLPPTVVWSYGDSFPGPVFDTRSGEGLIVEWANELPTKHFLPIDHTLHGAEADKPEVRAVVHLHGGKSPPESDGYPESWFVPGQVRDLLLSQSPGRGPALLS